MSIGELATITPSFNPGAGLAPAPILQPQLLAGAFYVPKPVTEEREPQIIAAANDWLDEGLESTRLTKVFASGQMAQVTVIENADDAAEVARERKRRLMMRMILAGRLAFADTSQSFIAKVAKGRERPEVALRTWARELDAGIPPKHYAELMALNGSRELTPADRTVVREAINQQLLYLGGFIRFVGRSVEAETPLDGRLVSRARQYASAAWQTAHNAFKFKMEREGYGEAIRVLGINDNHCYVCVALARRGWQPISLVPPLGDSLCGAHCHCEIFYR